MLDNTKFLTYNQDFINRVLHHSDFIPCKPKTNNYHSLMHKDFGVKLSLDFRKAMERGIRIGYTHLEINTSPHYHFNQYRHNGNDLTPENARKSVIDILTYLGIKQSECNELKVCNIEFGLNIIPESDIKNLINGLYFYKKTPFVMPNVQYPFFKKTDATAYKQIKAYAKGLQFEEYHEYGIDVNTFRFEVKSKQSKNIKRYGINTATDLLKLETYNRLGQSLLDEWEQILIINLEPNLTALKPDEIDFITKAKSIDFWSEMISPKYRNKFARYKEKYFKILGTKNNLHHLIKIQIIDKLFNCLSGANSTQRTPINRGKQHFEETPPTLLNLEYAHFDQNIRVCKVTNLDISMQRKGSKFLCSTGLKFYKKHHPDIYEKLEERYLTETQKGKEFDRQIYFIAHNIRNEKTNSHHNRKRFEQRNYHPNQLQLF